MKLDARPTQKKLFAENRFKWNTEEKSFLIIPIFLFSILGV